MGKVNESTTWKNIWYRIIKFILTKAYFYNMENLNNHEHLPTVSLYAKYLQIASIRFNLSLDECRNKFGLFTNAEWLKLFNN